MSRCVRRCVRRGDGGLICDFEWITREGGVGRRKDLMESSSTPATRMTLRVARGVVQTGVNAGSSNNNHAGIHNGVGLNGGAAETGRVRRWRRQKMQLPARSVGNNGVGSVVTSNPKMQASMPIWTPVPDSGALMPYRIFLKYFSILKKFGPFLINAGVTLLMILHLCDY